MTTETSSPAQGLTQIQQELHRLYSQAVQREASSAAKLNKIPEARRDSGANLLHYLSLRHEDHRSLQSQLHMLGLSSLGRSEAYVLATLQAVLRAVHKLADHPEPEFAPAAIDFHEGRTRLADNTDALFGKAREGDAVRVMITMPTEAGEDYEFVRKLVAAGMDVMRINCSKDGPEVWLRMIEHLRRAEQEVGRSCKVHLDLAGPNPRTGPLQSKSKVAHWRPKLDRRGRLVRPASIWLTAETGGLETDALQAADEILPISRDLLSQLEPDDELQVEDTRGRTQRLKVTGCESDGCWAEADEEAFVDGGGKVELFREQKLLATGSVGSLADRTKESRFRLKIGDQFRFTQEPLPGRAARKDESGKVIEPARISCTLPEIFADVKVGDRFYYDDGAMSGEVKQCSAEGLLVEVTRARKGSTKMRADKGINFPDTKFSLPSLTDKDLQDLDFAVKHADIVGMSFVRKPEDVEQLLSELQQRVTKKNGESLGVVLKVETAAAFENLPDLLLTAMQWSPVGVMVARGDMGVELGFARMSEVQEEILWLCEAAHIPVIWATQVLENLNKTGLPTRAEVTDAAMSSRAECVMLNKGEHLVETVEFLHDILKRMQQHQQKKISTLRKLQVSELPKPS